MNVSIVIPVYNGKDTLPEVLKKAKKQDVKGKFEIIVIDDGKKSVKEIAKKYKVRYYKNKENLGLAGSMNQGIKKAKYEIIVSLHQDCIPENNKWLSRLIKPLEKNEIVATTSAVYLAKENWERFDFWHKVLPIQELGVTHPELDEKGCAYKKNILEKIKGFNIENFRTSGEDRDLYKKLQKHGKVVRCECKVIHLHTNYREGFTNQVKKEAQYAEGHGVNLRLNFDAKDSFYWKIIIKYILLFILLFIPNFSLVSVILIFILSNSNLLKVIANTSFDFRLFILPFVNFLIYFIRVIFIIKGFVTKKQRI